MFDGLQLNVANLGRLLAVLPGGFATLLSNMFAGTQTITPSTDQAALQVNASTGSSYASVPVELNVTWNTGSIMDAVTINVTDNLSFGNSRLFAISLGGTTVAQLRKDSVATTAWSLRGRVIALSNTAIPAGGTLGLGYLFTSTANFGIYPVSGAPTISAAKASLALRSDGGANSLVYVATDSAGTWVPLITDTSALAPLASPTLTGTPAAPTAAPGTNTTQLATTAFVVTSFAPLASPTFTGTPAAPTAAVGTNTTQLATTAFVQAARPTATNVVPQVLGGNVALNNTGTYFNGPNTGSIGAAGQVWLIFANANLSQSSAGPDFFLIHIWDGSSIKGSEPSLVSTAANTNIGGCCFAIVTLAAATTFTLRAKDTTSSNGSLNATGTSIGAVRLA